MNIKNTHIYIIHVAFLLLRASSSLYIYIFYVTLHSSSCYRHLLEILCITSHVPPNKLLLPPTPLLLLFFLQITLMTNYYISKLNIFIHII